MSAVVNKAWMNEPDIFSKTYRDGVKFFMNYAANYGYPDTTCSCPCSKCQNGKRLEMWEVRRHLNEKGIDRSYVTWFFHGENDGDSAARHPGNNLIPTEMDDEQVREGVVEDMGSFVDAAFGVFDRGDGVSGNEEVETEEFVPEPDLGKRYYRYKQLAEEKLYPGCNTSILTAIVELQNVKKTYKISANCVNSLLGVIKGWLPKGNKLPVKYTTMKSMLKDMGMKEKSIHMCENHCILYYKENADLTSCPECFAPRYKAKVDKFGEELSSNEPSKVLRYFPLGPRLKRLYTIPWIARAMTWHNRAEVSPDYMRHPVDSSQWDLVKKKFPEFANEGRNVWLGIATDGFNPHGMQSLNYSCWPVIVVVYNLPPSLCMKPEFQIMTMLIPGPKAPGQDIDVCLRVLVDELKDLFEDGISAFDAHKQESFQLRASLMFGIHDLPAQGNMSGCTTHGYFACVHCADKTRSAYLLYARKNVYPNYRIYLRGNHPFRKGENLGLVTDETKHAPKRLSGKKSLEKLAKVTYKPGKLVVRSKAQKRKRYDPDVDDDPYGDGVDDELTGAFYKESIFWELKTYRILYFRHCVDVMHTEKNVMEHILETIFDFGSKSMKSWNARDELKDLGLHCGQWTTSKPGSSTVATKPMFVLSKAEKESFCKILKDLKFPSGFASNLSNNVNVKNSSFGNFKSHDYHVIMEYLLPVCLQHAFPKHPELRRALHQISLYFRLLCSKVLSKSGLQEAKFMVAEAMCVLEKYFPALFFDISVHLTVHLADEALLCGPVRYRWMYPFERAMKEFKNIPSNKRYVEGSIKENNLVNEAVTYAMEHTSNPRDGNHQSSWEAFLGEESEYSDVGPMGKQGTNVTLDSTQFIQIRRWVLFRCNPDGLGDYYSYYCENLLSISQDAGKEVPDDEVEKQTEFIEWLYEKLLRENKTDTLMWRYVRGPVEAKEFVMYRVNGFVFSPRYYEETVGSQDSGVCMTASTTFRSKKGDKNPKTVLTKWYGVVNQILELDYGRFTEVVFYCDWVKAESGRKICPDSHLVLVNMNRMRDSANWRDEPAILAEEASGVFYSKDLKSADWWVVIHSPQRMMRGIDNLEKPEIGSFQQLLLDEPNLRPLLRPLTNYEAFMSL